LTQLATGSGAFDIGSNTDFKSLLLQQFPAGIVQPFLDNAIMPTVMLGLVLGFAVRTIARDGLPSEQDIPAKFGRFAAVGRRISEIALSWIVRFIPAAVFAAAAKVVAQHGLEPFKGLAVYVGWCLAAMILHVLIVYHAWIVLYARRSLAAFWRLAVEPVSYAFGVNSSLVSLPVTLKALDRLGVHRSASTLAACIGTNLNNDGIILYEGFTLLVIAQAMGQQLGIEAQILAGIYCVIAAMGVAGIPEAGVVALTLVLTAFGISTEMIAILLSVDWILARARSAVNVLSDMTGSIVIDAMQRRSGQVAR
jgi:DAACS family dicarboxylate/amino acid:cation (Na+ or H+) symporter